MSFSLFKYYKGEDKNPYIAMGELFKARFWDGEKMFFEHSMIDENFKRNLADSLSDAIDAKQVHGILIDESIPFDKRLLIFYLDLWYGKCFPYDINRIVTDY